MSRWIVVLLGVSVSVGCGELARGPDGVGSPTPGPGIDRPPPVPRPQEAALWVEYGSSIAADGLEAALSGLTDNALFKFARNTARVSTRPAEGQTVRSLRVWRGEALVFEGLTDAEPEATVVWEVPLPTAEWPEGVHPLRYVAVMDGGARIEGTEEVLVHFNVTAIAAAADPHQLWVGTFEAGLVSYHLGEDPLDPGDDTVHAYGGRPLEWGDVTGDAWRDDADGGVDAEAPTGRVVLELAATDRGVWVGTGFRGLAYVEPVDADAPDEAWYASFHPGQHGDEEGLEAGFANSVSALAADRGPCDRDAADDCDATGLWVGTFLGLYHFEHGGTPFEPRDDVWTLYDHPALDPNVADLAVDDRGRLWIAAFDITDSEPSTNTLTMLDPRGTPSDPSDDEWVRLALPADLPNDALTLALDGGQVWLGTADGLWNLHDRGTPDALEDDTWRRFGRDTGLPDDQVGALRPLGDGRLWVGTFDACGGDGGGLALLDPRTCAPHAQCPPEVVYTVADGLLDDDVSSIHLLPDGQVALGTFNALAAPLVASLSGAPGGDACVGGPDPERSLRPATFVGRDGLSIIDPGLDLASKEDDALVNL